MSRRKREKIRRKGKVKNRREREKRVEMERRKEKKTSKDKRKKRREVAVWFLSYDVFSGFCKSDRTKPGRV